MKPQIMVVLFAATALAIVATPDTNAKAWGGPHHHGMSLQLSGSSYSITTLEDGTATSVPPFTAIQNGIAKGKLGRALIQSQTFAGDLGPAGEGDCPDGLPFRGPLTISFVLTYNDGSLLSGVTDGDDYYCTDGTVFATEASGTVSGGAGRFEGASGAWEVGATVQGSRLTGDLSIDLD